MGEGLFTRFGVTDFSRQFRFLFASQVMMYLLGSLLFLSKKEIPVDARLVNAIERQLKNQIPDLRLEVKVQKTKNSGYRLPKTFLSKGVVWIVFRPSAGRDNYHFAIDVYYSDGEPIYTEHKVSPRKQDERLAAQIANAVKRAIKNLNN